MSVNNLTTDKLRLEVERLLIENIKLCQDHFLYFVKEMWPDFIYRKTNNRDDWGHHQIIAQEFTDIAQNKKGRLIINMPPRHTKSEFASIYFPAWIIGKFCRIKSLPNNTSMCAPWLEAKSLAASSKPSGNRSDAGVLMRSRVSVVLATTF